LKEFKPEERSLNNGTGMIDSASSSLYKIWHRNPRFF